jgi:hypothetical protein
LNATLAVGVTGRLIQEKIDDASASALSSDLGVLKRFEEHPLTVGFALRHLGQKIKFREISDPQPLTADLGAGYKLFRDRLLLGVDVLSPRGNGTQYALGAEWKQPLAREFGAALRAGYNNAVVETHGAIGVALGGGIRFRSLELDFAWVPFGELGNTFRYAALMRF